jgi:hypothetical protein
VRDWAPVKIIKEFNGIRRLAFTHMARLPGDSQRLACTGAFLPFDRGPLANDLAIFGEVLGERRGRGKQQVSKGERGKRQKGVCGFREENGGTDVGQPSENEMDNTKGM